VGRDALDIDLIWVICEAKYFRKIRKNDSTGFDPTGKSVAGGVHGVVRTPQKILIFP
jgi:hypothetical protein